ncbi:uncharacterized protein MELLADRAFT_85010 [Melampsora larici-populina 98AG31]|uniref:Uncharacterized protein n=1 Tax=Melampsora larici-populina (strain 98AG31 / pathotype 3-4-7) TaxID=747676 RepID=F4RH02_MELLP|nr:uncharacterized protein MELLADRAFT_85010 [Melampsora larici-populina 98AG31]EGG08319.1 hypothetical protein MELLADRAFT_85010 [Melampsora larici-populina 98AG31]
MNTTTNQTQFPPTQISRTPPIANLNLNARTEVLSQFSANLDPNVNAIPLPMELQVGLSPQEWDQRSKDLYNHFSKFVWSKLLRIYLIFSILFTMLGPVIVNVVVNKIFFDGVAPLRLDSSPEEITERLSLLRKAHIVNFAISILVVLLIWVPYYSIKLMGRNKLRALLGNFNNQDAAKGNMSALVWSCPRTSTLQGNATVSIQLPISLLAARQPTLFSNGAYLPPYLQKEPTMMNTQAAPAYEYPPAERK